MKKKIVAFSLALTSLFTFNTNSYFCNDVSALTVISDIKDISLDKDVINVGETAHLNAEWEYGGATLHAECYSSDSSVAKVVSGSADNGWDIEGISNGTAEITVRNDIYSKTIDITVQAVSESFDWLPKTMDEYEEFIAENGIVSVHGKYLIYCDEINYSTGSEVIMEQTGTAKIKKIKEYGIENETDEPLPPGTPSNIVYVYEAVSSGNVRVTISQGRSWDTEAPKEVKSSENYNVDENLIITKSTDDNSVRGDINADGLFNVADIVIFRKWLLGVSDVNPADLRAADLCEDLVLNVSDLCMMKNKLITLALNENIYSEKRIDMIQYSDIIFENSGELSAVITSTKELKEYLLQNDEESMIEPLAEKYNDTFFKNNVLLVNCIYQSCGTDIMYKIDSVGYEGNSIIVDYSDNYNVYSGYEDVVNGLLAQVVIPKEKYHADSVEWRYTSQDDKPVLMITDYMITESENGWGSECYERVITADGNRYSRPMCDCAFLSVEDHINHIKDEGEKEQYITDTEVLQTICEFAENTEKYKDCEMKETGLCIADYGRMTLSVLYKDENGNMQSLELYRYGDEGKILDNPEVQDFVGMLIYNGYIDGMDFLAYMTPPAPV